MNIAVFDLETNGYAGSSVLSASSIVFDERGRILSFFNRFYMPAEPFNRYLFKVHGLTPERLSVIRETIPSEEFFVDDCHSLGDFWDEWDVRGVVIHNSHFDMGFLPEMMQAVTPCWCSMRGLTEFCGIPRKRGQGFKYPRLSEAAEILCCGDDALTPPPAAALAEDMAGDDLPHVSLSDCFELYRITSRVMTHMPELMQFDTLNIGYRIPPSTQRGGRSSVIGISDDFTDSLLKFDALMRDIVRRSAEA